MLIKKNELELINVEGKIVGITSGCYDLIHYYHLIYLQECKSRCDLLIVGVDSDNLVHKNKNKYPIINQRKRQAMVEMIADVVFVMDSVDDLKNAYKYCDKVFKNADTIYGNKVEIPDGIELEIVPDIEEITSTTEIINKIKGKTGKN